MDNGYLKKNRYDWERDPRHLKIKSGKLMLLPAGRCACCGRLFLNAENAIVYCRDCDKAMSTCHDGPDHDFDTFANKIEYKDGRKIKLTARREVRTPIEFDKEHEYFDKNSLLKEAEQPHFTTAAGKIIPIDADSDLYKLGAEI